MVETQLRYAEVVSGRAPDAEVARSPLRATTFIILHTFSAIPGTDPTVLLRICCEISGTSSTVRVVAMLHH
eukprot:669973-Rhodomonas_salina.2